MINFFLRLCGTRNGRDHEGDVPCNDLASQAKYPNSKQDVDREYKVWQLKNPFPAGEAKIIADHIDHVVKMAGIDCVGLGSDYDGITTIPKGMEDVSTYPLLTELMLQRGYSEEDIHKVLYKNVLCGTPRVRNR